MESTQIQLNINKESIILISDYNPPRKIIERKLDLLFGTGHKVTLAGNFSAKNVIWPARQSDVSEKRSSESLLQKQLHNFRTVPTYAFSS
jgi:hypothetical protein